MGNGESRLDKNKKRAGKGERIGQKNRMSLRARVAGVR